MQEVHFAILGCGRIGFRHAEKLQGVRGARLVGVFDSVTNLAEKLATQYKTKTYTKLSEFLADPEIDFVNICTPSGLHAEHSIAALNAGKNVLCEKPMALKASDAEAMVIAANKNNKLLFVVKQNRFNPSVRLATLLIKGVPQKYKLFIEKEINKNIELGKPIGCVANVFWNRNEDYYKQASWRGTKELAGGALFTLASHFVDLIISFMGEPKSVFAYIGRGGEFTKTEDTGIISAEFKNGGYGALNYTACVAEKNLEGSLTLIFQNGTIQIGGEYLNDLKVQIEGLSENDHGYLKRFYTDAVSEKGGAYDSSKSNHEGVFGAIVSHMNGAPLDEALVAGENALASVRFMESAYESAETKQVVHFS